MHKQTPFTPRISFWLTVCITTVIAILSRGVWGADGIWNEGIAFSLAIPTSIIYMVSGLTLVALVLWASASDLKHRLKGIGLGLIVGGGIANLADRLVNDGRVWDYIPFFGIGYFNVSDVAVMLGLAIIIYEAWRTEGRG